MHSEEVLEQARFIFSSVVMMRDLMFRAQRKSSWFAKRSGLESLTLPQMHAVFAVQARGEVTISQLAEALDVSPPSVSVMVDRLVEKGVLQRRHCKEDRRRVMVCMSPRVDGAMKEFEDTGLTVFAGIVEKIGPETSRKWVEVFEEIRQSLDDGDLVGWEKIFKTQMKRRGSRHYTGGRTKSGDVDS
ncbi:transcriptional regulator, MarR family [Desulfatibacillum aliphaticivorans]|uniref:Transcriptional regulator, MarR family n=1 Tax=Desulfatibacillum aliphaticivorans TaxID=218208 RepID=B8FLF9_DESAL|nr:MarR family transcriptional regulator [Desulfatibacillum aliphaticivorans]ACL05105.1 transcriptional regulator, MarR family [Desulfatibacillum aliphaticivorans]